MPLDPLQERIIRTALALPQARTLCARGRMRRDRPRIGGPDHS